MLHRSILGGRVVYHTHLLPIVQAERLASCLRRHPKRFAYVSVRPSQAVDAAACEYSLLHPHAECRRASRSSAIALVGDEGVPAYIYLLDTEANCYWAINPATGEAYELTGERCSCARSRFCCEPAGLRCPHSLSLVTLLQSGDLPRLPRRLVAVGRLVAPGVRLRLETVE